MSQTQNEKITYFLYARKSSDSEDRQVQSIEDQIRCLKELATKLNLQVKEVFTESKSAKSPYQRPVFADMIKRIEKGEANGILCWKLDRLARNPVDAGAISWMLQNSILRHIKSHDGNFFPWDNTLLLSVEFGIANQYIIDLRKACRRGLEGKALRGWMPTMPPAGYLNDKNTNTIVMDKERFHLIRKMWDLMLTGSYNPQQIREIANKEWGYRTRQFKRQGGAPLATCTLYKLFTNIFYTGMFEWGGKLYNGKHTPMITVQEYDKVQVLLGKRGRPRPKEHTFAFTGLVHCGECGCMITGSEKYKVVKTTGEVKSYSYYHCTKKRHQLNCSQRPMTMQEFNTQVQAMLETIAIPEGLYQAVVEYIEGSQVAEAEAAARKRDMQTASLAKTKRELENLTKMRYRDLIDDNTFLKEQEVLQEQQIRLKQELLESTDNVDTSNKRLIELFKFAHTAAKNFPNASASKKKEMLVMLGSNCLVKDKKLFIEAVEWVKVMQKIFPPLRAEFQWLEPIISPYFSMDNPEMKPLIPIVRRAVEDVRTALLKDNCSEPDNQSA